MASQDPFEFIRRQQEQIRKLTESPALEAIRRQQEQFRKLTESPLLEAARKQQEQIAKLSESPIIDALRRQEEQFRLLSESPVLKAMAQQQEQMRRLTESPTFVQMQEHQQRLAEFVASLPLDPLEDFQQELARQANDYAAREIAADPDLLGDERVSEREASSSSYSLRFLLWQIEGLLKVFELITTAGFAANEQAGEAVFSPQLLYIMVMIVMTGEVIIWFSKPPDPNG